MVDEEATACELNGDANVAERWSWVQSHLPKIAKTSKNKQQDFMYRSIDAVLDEVSPLFGKAGVFVLPARQKATYHERATRSGGVSHVCFLEATWQIYGVKGDHLTAETVGEAADTFDKATSKAQTAAFKYLLWPGLAVSGNEDNDGDTPEETAHRATLDGVKEGAQRVQEQFRNTEPPSQPTLADPITPKQKAKIEYEMDKAGYATTDLARMVNTYGDPGWQGSLGSLEKWQASKLIDDLVK